MPPPIAPAARLRADLDRLGDLLAEAGFGLADAHADDRRRLRDGLVATVRSYLIARLGDPQAPLLVVVAGPTGSGKSTLVNSLAESEVSRPGPLRPTTRQPVVWCHVGQAERYDTVGGVSCKVQPDDHPLLTDLTIVDTPDIDSYVAEHRQVTVEVLRHADVAIFLTTAQRYADAVPWEVLGQIDRRGSIVVHVLNRLNRRASGAVSDYAALLRAHGLDHETIFTIQEQRVRGDGALLPARSIRRLSDHLVGLAAERDQVLHRVTAGAVAYVIAGARQMAGELRKQELERQRLGAVVNGAYGDALAELTSELDQGTLIRAEVVERWSERVGTSDVSRWVRGSASWFRSVADRLSGTPASTVQAIEGEARSELGAAVGTRLDRAARTVSRGWEVEEAGRSLLTSDLAVTSETARAEADLAIDRWLAGLTRMVQEEAPGRFRAARLASTGVNAAAVATIVAIFASTGGLTGAEVGVAAGAAAAQQGLLEHLLGKAAAGSLAGAARDTLVGSISHVFDEEAGRFHRILDAAADPVELADSIEEMATVVETSSEEFHAL